MIKNENKAPKNACQFNDIAVVNFSEDEAKYDFKISGYSGKVIQNHWWWGNLAFDLAGLKFAKTKTPVLLQHDLQQRIGFANKQTIDSSVEFEGVFLDNAKAVELKADLKKGFPMEASLSLVPSAVEYIKEGESASVNGFTLKGPGAIFRKAIIKEVSMCVFGADNNTSSKAFTDGGECDFITICGKETKMSDDLKMTAESFAANNPELHSQVAAKGKAEGKAEAEKEFKERVETFTNQFGDDAAFCLEMLKGNVSFSEALKKQADKLKKQVEEFKAKKPEACDTAKKVDAAKQEFSDDKEALTKADLKTLKDKGSFNEQTATKEELEAHFAETPELKAEFSAVENYVACIIHERGGK